MKTAAWWALVLCLAVGAGFGFLAFFPSSAEHGGGARGWPAFVARMIMGLVVVVALVLRHAHRKRSPGPVPAPRQPQRVGTADPGAIWFFAVVLTGIIALAATVASTEYSHWKRSEAVQDHGLRATATVEGLESVTHHLRYGTYKTVNLEVSLVPPVAGLDQTTVSTKYTHSPFRVGSQVVVLLSQNDPGYAELPGHPVDDYGEVALLGVLGGLCVLVAIPLYILAARNLRTVLRRRSVGGQANEPAS